MTATVELFVGCLTSQQHASVSQGRICSVNFTCCHSETEAADQTFHLTQSQRPPPIPSSNPARAGIFPGSSQTTGLKIGTSVAARMVYLKHNIIVEIHHSGLRPIIQDYNGIHNGLAVCKTQSFSSSQINLDSCCGILSQLQHRLKRPSPSHTQQAANGDSSGFPRLYPPSLRRWEVSRHRSRSRLINNRGSHRRLYGRRCRWRHRRGSYDVTCPWPSLAGLQARRTRRSGSDIRHRERQRRDLLGRVGMVVEG